MDALHLPALPPGPMGMDLNHMADMVRPGNARAIETVARGFESMFISILVKQMRESQGTESLFKGDKGDVLGGMFDYFMGQHLSQAGGLGIGAMVRKQLTPPPRNP